MIIQWFAEMFYKVITGLLGWIHMPNLPSGITETVSEYLLMLNNTAFSLFRLFVPDNIVEIGIPILLAITAFKYGYYFVMWILKKIPAAAIN